MKAIVQRVKFAKVEINNQIYSQINQGFLIYLGVTHDDSLDDAIKLANKIKNLRVFEDENGKMNLDLSVVKGEVLVVSQFTLYADMKRGNRPSFTKAADPNHATKLYEEFVQEIKKTYIVKTGKFGAEMQITSINDGPVTLIYDTEEL